MPDQHHPPDQTDKPDKTERADLLFGLVSIIDQFAGVLKERGKEFQNTRDGQRLGAQIATAYRSLDHGQKAVLDMVVTTLDQLIDRVKSVDDALHAQDKDPARDPEGER